MAEFSQSLTSIAVAQLLSMAGIDRIHGSAHDALVQIAEKYLQTLATLTQLGAQQSNRSIPNTFDSLVAFDHFQVDPKSLVEYVEIVRELKTRKEKVEVFKFPRLEPKQVPNS